MVMETERSEIEIDLAVIRAAILGDSLFRIRRKTGISEVVVRKSLSRLIRTKRILLNRRTGYYFVTEEGEKFLSVADHKQRPLSLSSL